MLPMSLAYTIHFSTYLLKIEYSLREILTQNHVEISLILSVWVLWQAVFVSTLCFFEGLKYKGSSMAI